MVEVLPGNGLQSTLSAAIDAVTTSIPIQAIDAASWPGSGSYRAVLWTDPSTGPWEVVTVTSGQGTATLGVVRASEAYRGSQVARAWAIGSGIAAVLTKRALDEQRLTMKMDEFLPANAVTTVTLSSTPEQIVMVARNGVVQSAAAGHYTLSTNVVTFTAALNGSERVIVSYSVRGP